MEELTQEYRIFFNRLTKLKPQDHKGYLCFVFKKKKYKRSRVLIQLHLNKKLNIFECVHHKDKNRTNDNINNLEIMTVENHTSKHHAGRKHKGKSGGHNKISKELEKRIYKLCEVHKKNNGHTNYSKVGRVLNLAGQTIRRYHLKKNNS